MLDDVRADHDGAVQLLDAEREDILGVQVMATPGDVREPRFASVDVGPEVDADELERRVQVRKLRPVASAYVDDPFCPEPCSDPARIAIDIGLPDDTA